MPKATKAKRPTKRPAKRSAKSSKPASKTRRASKSKPKGIWKAVAGWAGKMRGLVRRKKKGAKAKPAKTTTPAAAPKQTVPK